MPRKLVRKLHAPANKVLENVARKFEHVEFYKITDLWCGENNCKTIFNNEFLYRDVHHIRRNLNEGTKEQLVEKLKLTPLMQ
ncbi:MAG: SGNH hydrolase domain-containing protein [Hyphomicrobiaceae bacterium]